MLKILGRRGSGKTYAAIQLASQEGADLLCDSEKRAKQLNDIIKSYGIDNVKAVSVAEDNKKYIMDDVEKLFMRAYNNTHVDVVGFTATIEADDIILEM